LDGKPIILNLNDISPIIWNRTWRIVIIAIKLQTMLINQGLISIRYLIIMNDLIFAQLLRVTVSTFMFKRLP
jgi:hypothetical protein